MQIPEGRFYTEYHLWVQQEPGGVRIGMTPCGCESLGSIDYVELPSSGTSITKDDPFGWVETSKAITELLAPVSGMVQESNPEVTEAPATIASDPYGSGWLIFVKPSDASEIVLLMTAEQYSNVVATEEIAD